MTSIPRCLSRTIRIRRLDYNVDNMEFVVLFSIAAEVISDDNFHNCVSLQK